MSIFIKTINNLAKINPESQIDHRLYINNYETFKGMSIKNDSKTKENIIDTLYKELLRSYSYAIVNWVISFKPYKHWNDHWKYLLNNIEKNSLKINQLSENDKLVAYNYNKCEYMSFRWKDEKGYLPKNVFLYVLLHELAHAAFPSSFKHHKDPFSDILCLLCVAAVELDLIQINKLPNSIFISNSDSILSKESFISEVKRGIELLSQYNDDETKEYYQSKLRQLFK